MKPRHTVKLALGQTQMLERSWCNNDVLCLLWKREQCTINWDLTENLCGRRATCNQLQLSVNTPWRCQRLMSQRWSSSTQRQPWHSWYPNAGSVIMLFLSVYLLCILLYFYRLSRDIFCSKKFLEDNTPTVCSLFASLVTKITRIFWRVLTWSGFYLDCLPPTHQEIVAFFFFFFAGSRLTATSDQTMAHKICKAPLRWNVSGMNVSLSALQKMWDVIQSSKAEPPLKASSILLSPCVDEVRVVDETGTALHHCHWCHCINSNNAS